MYSAYKAGPLLRRPISNTLSRDPYIAALSPFHTDPSCQLNISSLKIASYKEREFVRTYSHEENFSRAKIGTLGYNSFYCFVHISIQHNFIRTFGNSEDPKTG